MPKLKRLYVTQLMISLEWRLPGSFDIIVQEWPACERARAGRCIKGEGLFFWGVGVGGGELQNIQTKPGCSQYTGEFQKHTQTQKQPLTQMQI